MKNYLLGKLPKNTINFFLVELLKRKVPNVKYQWIHFDEYLNKEFLKIFVNDELKIQWHNNKPIQKAFYSEPGYGFTIHKDGLQCRSALNIVVSCNSEDWVRWYDEDYINQISKIKVLNNGQRSSRDTYIINYENIPFIEELHNEVGDVYVLDVDSYHSFKCIGKNPRIIIQTKFDGFPNLDYVYESLKKKSFNNLI